MLRITGELAGLAQRSTIDAERVLSNARRALSRAAGRARGRLQLAPTIKRAKQRTGTAPRKVAADRGYGEAKVDQDLEDIGVETVVIPRKGQPGQARREHERAPSFRRLIKWRTGSQGRISHLNTATAGTAHSWTDASAPGSGADTGSWPTTS